jgi:tRNA (mo5U34)-methyltransferase
MDPRIRFSSLVRHGLRFRSRFELAKLHAAPAGFPWYPYDSFANLFPLERLRREAGLALAEMAGDRPLLDLGAGDGALAFLFESLGYAVHACDHAGANINRMEGVRRLAAALGSHVEIEDVDLDAGWAPQRDYGLALFLGTLYHLKNPYGVLERLSGHARYCFLSTRVATWSADHAVELGRVAAAYLLAPGECNGDATNYWVFSPPGLLRLAERCGWRVLASLGTGAADSDPASEAGDARRFLLLESSRQPRNLQPGNLCAPASAL